MNWDMKNICILAVSLFCITGLILTSAIPASAQDLKNEYPTLSQDYSTAKTLYEKLFKKRLGEIIKYIEKHCKEEVAFFKKYIDENITVKNEEGKKHEISSRHKTIGIEKGQDGLWYFKISN